jgi:hypothetical protein
MFSKRWSWLAALAILFAGVTNAHAHVHLCYDGQEPAAAVHVDGFHAEETVHADAKSHDDRDLELAGTAIVKAVKHDLPLALPATAHLPEATAPPPARAERSSAAPEPAPAPHLRPPLRAPPR